MTQTIGVDACPGGWVAVEISDLRFAEAQVKRSFAELVAAYPQASVVAVDIPIGLPETGRRPGDEDARKFVGARRSSVFFTPTRQLLETPWAAGLGISKQAHSLGPRIFEVENALTERIHEVHPEVSFAAMKGRPLETTKLSWNGLMERRALLAAQGILLPDELGDAGSAPADDLLDAAAAAWSAHRIATRQAMTLPAAPSLDSLGRPIAIWY